MKAQVLETDTLEILDEIQDTCVDALMCVFENTLENVYGLVGGMAYDIDDLRYIVAGKTLAAAPELDEDDVVDIKCYVAQYDALKAFGENPFRQETPMPNQK